MLLAIAVEFLTWKHAYALRALIEIQPQYIKQSNK